MASRSTWIALIGSFVLVFWSLSGGGTAADQSDDEAASVLEIRVLDAAQAPLSGAIVSNNAKGKVKLGTTDAEGLCKLPLPAGSVEALNVNVTMQGHVPMRWFWNRASGGTLPNPMTFRMEKAISIGGLVRDEDGQPIAGVTVALILPTNDSQQPRPRVYDLKATTDREGRWHVDGIPPTFNDVWIRLAHRDFISDPIYNTTPRPAVEQLRDRTGVMVMRRGVAIAGRVVDEQGQPIVDAVIRQGHDRFGTNYPTTKTDDRGEFKFGQVSPGRVVLTARAPGHAPDLKEVDVKQGPVTDIEFRLEQGHTIRGRIVDAAGNPVAGAFVAADTWRQKRSLDWRVDTDKDGRFVWGDAPADEVLMDIGKSGYMSIRHRGLKARDEEQTIVLSQSLVVVGRVVDDATGEPIKEFQAIKGLVFPNHSDPLWQRRDARRGANGQFTLAFSEPQNKSIARVESLGYAPVESRPFGADDGQQTFEFRMKPAENITGVVVGPDGQPVSNVNVAMATGIWSLQINRGRITSDVARSQTGPDGVFVFPPQNEPYLLAIAEEKGFAAAPQTVFETDHRLRLVPWGRLEGRVSVGKLGAHGKIALHGEAGRMSKQPSLNSSDSTTADAEGHFVFDHLIPGPAKLCLTDGGRPAANGMTITTFIRTVPVEIESGKTITADIGGKGSNLTGHLVSSDGADPSEWSATNGVLRLVTDYDREPVPADWEHMSEVEKQAWHAQFVESPEGKTFAKKKRLATRTYTVAVGADGRFQLDAVPAGKYRFEVKIFGTLGKMLGTVDHEIIVPEPSDQADAEPLEVGAIRLVPFNDLEIGDPAPEIAALRLDGGPFALSDLRGRFVVLDFWATWCGPCIQEMPNLKQVQEAYGKNDRFALVSLSLDAERQTAADYAQREGLGWLQVHLGEWSETKVPDRFGVFGIPAIFLIGPDGRVLAKYLRGAAIKQSVAKALGENPPEPNAPKSVDK